MKIFKNQSDVEPYIATNDTDTVEEVEADQKDAEEEDEELTLMININIAEDANYTKDGED